MNLGELVKMNKFSRKVKKQIKKAYDLKYRKKRGIAAAIVVTHSVKGNKIVFYRRPRIIFVKDKRGHYNE